MNLNDEDATMNDAPIMITPPPTNLHNGHNRRFGRYRDHLTQQPRAVSLRDFGLDKSNDAPSTPPSSGSKRHLFGSDNNEPPECPRHERPINRRLLLTEAQERLSLPDLFAPSSPAPARRRVRAVPQRPSLVPIQPRLEQWGDIYGESQPHSFSQRSFFSHMNPGDY